MYKLAKLANDFTTYQQRIEQLRDEYRPLHEALYPLREQMDLAEEQREQRSKEKRETEGKSLGLGAAIGSGAGLGMMAFAGPRNLKNLTNAGLLGAVVGAGGVALVRDWNYDQQINPLLKSYTDKRDLYNSEREKWMPLENEMHEKEELLIDDIYGSSKMNRQRRYDLLDRIEEIERG